MTLVNYVVWNFSTKETEVKQLNTDDRSVSLKCEAPVHVFAPGAGQCVCTLIPISRIR